MRAVAMTAALLTLAACAGPIEDPMEVGARAPAPARSGDGASIRIASAGQAARSFAEEVAARCLLDGVVGGEAMIVERATGRIVIVGQDDELVTIDVLPSGSGSRLRLSGPAADDPSTRQAMLYHIERAARTGDTSCPVLPA